MRWTMSHRADPRARLLADRHYSRQKPGTDQFVPPGRCLVLITPGADALWVTSWPLTEYTHHEWAGAWMCTPFRNESDHLSSELIQEAVLATRWYYGDPPDQGFVTFVNQEEVRSTNPGYCYLCAGWHRVGRTKRRGYLALQLTADEIPAVGQPPRGAQRRLHLGPALTLDRRSL